MTQQVQLHALNAAIASLSPREQLIVRGILGLDGKEPTTRTEMAKRLGMNVGAVNKAYQRALKKCKKNVPK